MPGPYELYLIRHGVAEERGEKWPDDTKRSLRADGIARMRRAAKGLARLGVKFDVVLTSPLVRTRQTADIVAAAFDQRPPIVLADSLAPDDPRRTQVRSAKEGTAYYQIPQDSSVRALYENDALSAFVGRALEIEPLYRSDDPLGALNFMYYGPGNELGVPEVAVDHMAYGLVF